MLILLILLAVAGIATAVFAMRADNQDSAPLKDKVSMSQPSASASFVPSGIPKEPKKNPLLMLAERFTKKK